MENFLSLTAEPKSPNVEALLGKEQQDRLNEYNKSIQNQYIFNRSFGDISTKGIHEKLQPYAQEMIDKEFQNIANIKGRNNIETNQLQNIAKVKLEQKLSDLAEKSKSLNMVTKYDPQKHLLTPYGTDLLGSVSGDQTNFDLKYKDPTTGNYNINNVPLYESREDVLKPFLSSLPKNVDGITTYYQTPNGDYMRNTKFELPQTEYEKYARQTYQSKPNYASMFPKEQDYVDFVNQTYDTNKIRSKEQNSLAPNYQQKLNIQKDLARFKSSLSLGNQKQMADYKDKIADTNRDVDNYVYDFVADLQTTGGDFIKLQSPPKLTIFDNGKTYTEKNVLHNVGLNKFNYGYSSILNPAKQLVKVPNEIIDFVKTPDNKHYIVYKEPYFEAIGEGAEQIHIAKDKIVSKFVDINDGLELEKLGLQIQGSNKIPLGKTRQVTQETLPKRPTSLTPKIK